ncbi:hypothetical protein TRFO_03119 [Tritrichomonas foetus]|uniref:Uncharacterized protein n=1 Tax=Tritrichomonas foetus TaxID=1144522 RepID=A0A1J4KT92_9EUKA|nr:hypothetical protein TRFO_03119 [Tritrichomonas foetus]|eukprot:OHT14104.1 hypothetical protein TRFO_03119 [Tritrichomonas foetus]
MLDATPELNLLRKQHQEAIRKCEFIKAKELNDQINSLNDSIQKSNYVKKKMDNNYEYTHIKDCVRSSAQEEFTRANRDIFLTKTDFQRRLSQMLLNQAQELKDLASDFAKALELCTIRTVVDSDLITNEAQIRAKFHEYETAQMLFIIAKNTREMTVQQRQDEVRREYENLQETMRARHQRELSLNSQKRYQCFVEIKTRYDREITKLKKTLAASAIKLQVTQNFEEEERLFEELVITPKDDDLTDIPRVPPSPKSRTATSPGRFRSSPMACTSPRSPRSPRSPKMSPKTPSAKSSPKLSQTQKPVANTKKVNIVASPASSK